MQPMGHLRRRYTCNDCPYRQRIANNMRTFFIAIIYFLLGAVINRAYHLLQGTPGLPVTPPPGRSIKWDTTSLRKISAAGVNAFYPRMLQLQDGNLLIAYASGGNIIIQKSTDGGRSWQQGSLAATAVTGINMDTPELLQLANGEILLCYNGRPRGGLKNLPEAGKNFDIRLRKSDDNGASWMDEKTLYKAGESFKDGCWEPSAIQLPAGEVQLFFSDEAIYTTSNEQNISVLRSVDNGASWPVNPQIISFQKNSRDGMPVPVWLPLQKEIAIAIEDPGIKNFQTFYYSFNAGWAMAATSKRQRQQARICFGR